MRAIFSQILQVFVQTHIPRALEEVEDHEQDYERLAEGIDVEGIYYQTITGMRQDMSGAREGPAYAETRSQVSQLIYLWDTGEVKGLNRMLYH